MGDGHFQAGLLTRAITVQMHHGGGTWPGQIEAISQITLDALVVGDIHPHQAFQRLAAEVRQLGTEDINLLLPGRKHPVEIEATFAHGDGVAGQWP